MTKKTPEIICEQAVTLFHLSDLHIGKMVNGYSMLPEQRHIFAQIYDAIHRRKPDGILIAGDIYDTSIPSAEAVRLFDEFLTQIADCGVPVLIISGNHDSAERLSFGADILQKGNVFVSSLKPNDCKIRPIRFQISKTNTAVSVYLLPFLKPATVRHYFPDETIENYNDAVRVAVQNMIVDKSEINVLVAHQFVTGAIQCDSEAAVGGVDCVDVANFSEFAYVALGHLHRPQSCSRPEVRYSGSPLKYSFSEKNDSKSITIVKINENGEVHLDFEPLTPWHNWSEIRGSFSEITAENFYKKTPYVDDFLRITLTDELDVPDAIGKLRLIYKNIMELRYDNVRTRTGYVNIESAAEVTKSPYDLFADFFELQNGQAMTAEQQQFVQQLIEKIWED